MFTLSFEGKSFDIKRSDKFDNIIGEIREKTKLDGQFYINNRWINQYGFKKFVVTLEMLDMTPLQIFNKDVDDFKPKIELKNDIIYIDDLPISFKRTIRVHDDGIKRTLPSGLGECKIIEKDDSAREYYVPLYQFEAFWINLVDQKIHTNYAIKVGIGNEDSVDIISGSKWESGKLSQSPQNYLTVPKQYWLDGIKVADDKSDLNNNDNINLVRQFVVASSTNEMTIESQLLKEGKIDKNKGGLRLEIFKLGNITCHFRCGKRGLISNMKLGSQDLKVGNVIRVYSSKYPFSLKKYLKKKNNKLMFVPYDTIYIKTLTGKILSIPYNLDMTTEQLKTQIQIMEGIPTDQQYLTFVGIQLEDKLQLVEYNIQNESTLHLVLRLRDGDCEAIERLGLVSGGLIKQKIIKDFNSIDCYYPTCVSIGINIINSTQYHRIFKIPMPHTPINATTYILHGYPWFPQYGRELQVVEYSNKSLIGKQKSESKNGDICHICMQNKVNTKSELCGHTMCTECLEDIMAQFEDAPDSEFPCPSCRQIIEPTITIIGSAVID
jgi:hypothetical protein